MTLASLLIQLVVASAGLLGAMYAVTRPGKIKYHDLLIAAGFLAVPLLIVVAIQGNLSKTAITVVVGIIIGHVITHLDDD